MRTRSKSRNFNRPQQVPPDFVEPFDLEEHIENQDPLVLTMTDTRTMTQLLQAPTEGYEDAIIVPAITADNFELKHGLLTLVQNKQFFGLDKEDPHAHIRYFNKITSTLKFPNVPKWQSHPNFGTNHFYFSPSLTPFGDSDFLLEETDDFLAVEDEPVSPEIDDSYYDSEGDILLLEEFLNDDPSSPTSYSTKT
ncbi:hypothetical protein Tco_0135128 [Tanacetum coccineum]